MKITETMNDLDLLIQADYFIIEYFFNGIFLIPVAAAGGGGLCL